MDPQLPSSVAAARGKTFFFYVDAQPTSPGTADQSKFPGAGVYFPQAFNPGKTLNVVVFIHGQKNCMQNILAPWGFGTCTKLGPKRNAYNLIGQVEASGKNVLFILAETGRDAAVNDGGKLATKNGWKNFLNGVLQKLTPVLGSRQVTDIGRLIVFGHSAAYASTMPLCTQGGVDDQLHELHLLDTMYAGADAYLGWVKKHKGKFSNTADGFKFSNTYWGTKGASESMALTMTTSTAYFKSTPSIIKVDKTSSAYTPALWATPIAIKYVSSKEKSVPKGFIQHDQIPAIVVGQILAASPI